MKHHAFWSRFIALLFSASSFSANVSPAAPRARFIELMNLEFAEVALVNNHIATENVLASALSVRSTPRQPQGPFFPVRLPSEIDADLTKVGDGPVAAGIVILVQGQIANLDGNPIPGAKLEIWQACTTGKYHHPRDSNTAALDPYFQYYAAVTSDNNGYYLFKTIIPGPYPASPSWWRPEHIHMMVSADGYQTLTTQLYFDPASFPGTEIGKYNATDRILGNLSPEAQDQLIAHFYEIGGLNGHKLGTFNIYLEKTDRSVSSSNK